ncbi:hypothetical protein Anapl_00276 [Anas platyrhynchos]|uniref:Uncharacterized protein n=1 Tax=Anas platyrhynchos TaxID=8839 RepID=R0M1V2_ANAPL|nr:hypothetical protein Anapl_00276 [Anas platyrhynchos]
MYRDHITGKPQGLTVLAGGWREVAIAVWVVAQSLLLTPESPAPSAAKAQKPDTVATDPRASPFLLQICFSEGFQANPGNNSAFAVFLVDLSLADLQIDKAYHALLEASGGCSAERLSSAALVRRRQPLDPVAPTALAWSDLQWSQTVSTLPNQETILET